MVRISSKLLSLITESGYGLISVISIWRWKGL